MDKRYFLIVLEVRFERARMYSRYVLIVLDRARLSSSYFLIVLDLARLSSSYVLAVQEVYFDRARSTFRFCAQPKPCFDYFFR